MILSAPLYGTGQGGRTSSDTNIVKIRFGCRPGAIAQPLALREPKCQETATYGHFGREPYTKNGIKFFEWESAKDSVSNQRCARPTRRRG